jgi:hypothetical protein
MCTHRNNMTAFAPLVFYVEPVYSPQSFLGHCLSHYADERRKESRVVILSSFLSELGDDSFFCKLV